MASVPHANAAAAPSAARPWGIVARPPRCRHNNNITLLTMGALPRPAGRATRRGVSRCVRRRQRRTPAGRRVRSPGGLALVALWTYPLRTTPTGAKFPPLTRAPKIEHAGRPHARPHTQAACTAPAPAERLCDATHGRGDFRAGGCGEPKGARARRGRPARPLHQAPHRTSNSPEESLPRGAATPTHNCWLRPTSRTAPAATLLAVWAHNDARTWMTYPMWRKQCSPYPGLRG